MTAKKCTKKRDARAKILVWLIKPIAFFEVLVAVAVVGSLRSLIFKDETDENDQ